MPLLSMVPLPGRMSPSLPSLFGRVRSGVGGLRGRLARFVPAGVRARAGADRDGWADGAVDPWAPASWLVGDVDGDRSETGVVCNICRWQGSTFEGGAHSESALCPRCGSIARDRFLFFCLQARSPAPAVGGPRLRVLETSPRLGRGYRRAMAHWFDYLCSDFDERAHAGTVRIDLQSIDLADHCLDVVASPHVLEHVPDTGRALAELYRVIAPGGRLLLQVPLLQGRTARPVTPEFHGDNTPVEWRFGWDLTERLRAVGFTTCLLCTEGMVGAVDAGGWEGPVSPEFDVVDLLAHAVRDDLVAVASDHVAGRLGFEPAYMFATWECVKP